MRVCYVLENGLEYLAFRINTNLNLHLWTGIKFKNFLLEIIFSYHALGLRTPPWPFFPFSLCLHSNAIIYASHMNNEQKKWNNEKSVQGIRGIDFWALCSTMLYGMFFLGIVGAVIENLMTSFTKLLTVHLLFGLQVVMMNIPHKSWVYNTCM